VLGSLLDDVLKAEVGTELFSKVERIRSLAQCAAQLANKHDAVRISGRRSGDVGLLSGPQLQLRVQRPRSTPCLPQSSTQREASSSNSRPSLHHAPPVAAAP
jgi:hypothetical protein